MYLVSLTCCENFIKSQKTNEGETIELSFLFYTVNNENKLMTRLMKVPSVFVVGNFFLSSHKKFSVNGNW
jgi:hypothetical protein